MSDVLDAILDIDPGLTKDANSELVPVTAEVLPDAPTSTPANPEDALDNDLSYARNKIKMLIDSTHITLENAIALAEESMQPRGYEVVGTLLTAIVQANKELVELHRSRATTRKVQAEATGGVKVGAPGTVINNAVFVGKAHELLRELRRIKQIDVEVEPEPTS